ncbi:MAG: hypothetical protein ONB23_06770 [candidate division KSB1 bacterium]|nr:hypothetical protein [candidate division KSB1 bacterium]
MKIRSGLAAVIGAQAVALLAVWIFGAGRSSKQVVELPLAASTMHSILEANRLHLPLAWSRLHSFEIRVDERVLRKGTQAYLWLRREKDGWVPAVLSPERPAGSEPALLATVQGFEPVQRFEVSYAKGSESFRGTYTGPFRGKGEPGESVLVSADGERILFLSEAAEFENKVYGTVTAVRKSPASRYTYELEVRFPADGREITGKYTWNFYDPETLPQLGQVVSLSYVSSDGGYQITYVDLNPCWPGQIVRTEKGWSLQLDFGLEDFLPAEETLSQLQSVANTEGEIPLLLRAEVGRSGHLRPLALVAGSREIPLAR